MGATGFMAVGIGAALGAWMRWLLAVTFNAVLPALPLGTLLANLVGAYLMGLAIGAFSTINSLPPELKLLITTGFLGGLTTFSTFSAEAVDLYIRGSYGAMSVHVISHVVGSLILTFLGILTIQMLRH